MSKKKGLIIILLFLIIIIGISTIALITINKRKDDSKIPNSKKELTKEIITKNDDDKEVAEEEKELLIEEPIQEEIIENTNNQIPTATNNQSNNNYSQESSKKENNNQHSINQEKEPDINPPGTVIQPQPIYSCPADYILSGTQCISSYPATTSCAEGTHLYSDGTINGCVNINEGYYVEEDASCKEGYGMLMIVSLFEPNKYKCLPVYQSILTCNDGYSLQESTCSKVIPATQN